MDTLVAEATVRVPERGNQKEYATRYVHRELGEALMNVMVERKGHTVAAVFDSYARTEDNMWETWVYRGELKILTIKEYVVGEGIYTYYAAHGLPKFEPERQYSPPPSVSIFSTRQIMKELWFRFRYYMDSQEACSYVKPQSAYPDPEVFFMGH